VPQSLAALGSVFSLGFEARIVSSSVFISRSSQFVVKGEMANAVASMAGLRGASQAVLEGALLTSSSTRVPSHKSSSSSRVCGASGAAGKSIVVAVRAEQNEEPEMVSQSSRRSVLGLLAVSVAASTLVKEEAAQAEVASIPIEGPPPPSGGLRMSCRFFFVCSLV
jgi:photosystem II oxygen-evolving enhancer protein 3